MHLEPRNVRLGMVGGPGSNIGETHRYAARFDGRYALVAGVFASDADRSRAFAATLDIAPDRRYGAGQEMAEREARREDGIRVYGEQGSLEWVQEPPEQLILRPVDGPHQTLSRGFGWLSPAAQRASRLWPGHPEGFFAAFANIYNVPYYARTPIWLAHARIPS